MIKKRNIIPLLLSMLAAGCAKTPTNPEDPLEGYNRTVFAFNMSVDHLVIRPVAQTYNFVMPQRAQMGVTNVTKNIWEMNTFINDILQANFKYLVVDFWRTVINTTAGIGGLFDVATRAGIPPHVETFGLTLAKWRGGKQSPYFVIPILGPATITNGIGYAFDYYTSFWPYLKDQDINYIYWGVTLINFRSQLLPSDKLVETAFDPYAFVRDAYMQKDRERIDENEALGESLSSKAE